jgi:hypothetical protein
MSFGRRHLLIYPAQTLSRCRDGYPVQTYNSGTITIAPANIPPADAVAVVVKINTGFEDFENNSVTSEYIIAPTAESQPKRERRLSTGNERKGYCGIGYGGSKTPLCRLYDALRVKLRVSEYRSRSTQGCSELIERPPYRWLAMVSRHRIHPCRLRS